MKFNPRALIWFAVWAVAFTVLASIKSPYVDATLHVALWVIFGAMSVVAIVKMVRGGRAVPYSQADTLPRSLRRWVIGESGKDTKPH